MNNVLSKIRTPFRYTFKNATIALIIINFAVFFLYNFTNLIPISEDFFSLNVIGFVYRKFIWQPVTYMFMHANFAHLFSNMLGLFFFGLQVERAVGTKEFLLLYFVIGILSGLFSVAVFYALGTYQMQLGYQPYAFITQLIGASGAIYGILLAFAVIFPMSRIYVWFVLPVPAPVLVLVYALIEFFAQFSRTSNIAHYTHLAGFVAAFFYFIVRMGINPIKVWKDAFRK